VGCLESPGLAVSDVMERKKTAANDIGGGGFEIKYYR